MVKKKNVSQKYSQESNTKWKENFSIHWYKHCRDEYQKYLLQWIENILNYMLGYPIPKKEQFIRF